MAKHVWIGHGKGKNHYDLEILASGIKTGGQGDVYFIGDQSCVKVMHDPDESATQLTIIKKILAVQIFSNANILPQGNNIYNQVSTVSTVPLDLVWNENGDKVIGYIMDQLTGWHGLHEILTEADSQAIGIDLKSAGLILEALSRAVRLIHSQGFVIGDFNPSNVLFKRNKDRFMVKIIDVDSWSVYRSDLGIEFASKVLDTGVIYHPDIIKADRENKPWPDFTPSHDWWAFACIGWMVLTKYDPFMTGITDNCDREDRILQGLTSNRAATVRLHPDFGPAAQALGPKLRLYLDRCLKRKVKRPFPTKILEEFVRGLCNCDECGFTAHISAVICPKCANPL